MPEPTKQSVEYIQSLADFGCESVGTYLLDNEQVIEEFTRAIIERHTASLIREVTRIQLNARE